MEPEDGSGNDGLVTQLKTDNHTIDKGIKIKAGRLLVRSGK
jgi:hypothetical protein